jgi:hypothetical protein
MSKFLAFLFFLASCVPAIAGVSCSLPFNLQNGQPADATQVMANYNAIIACLGNAASAGNNSDITALTGLTAPLSPAGGGTPVFIAGSPSSGLNDQVVATTIPANFIQVANYQVLFLAGATNTGAMTLTVGGTPQLPVKKQTAVGLASLIGNEVIAGQIYAVAYDGTQYQLLNPSAASGVVTPITIAGPTVIPAAACGALLSLGGAAFYTVSFPPASGFAPGCRVTMINNDPRGKGIFIDSAPTIRLMPFQTLTVVQAGGSWVASPQTQLWGNPSTWYVNHVFGSDDPLVSDCLAPGAGACSTFQQAVNNAQLLTEPPPGGNMIQADCESASYAEDALSAVGSIQVAHTRGGIINFFGNASNPSTCALVPHISTTILDVQDGQQVTITGFEFGFASGINGVGVNARQFALVDVTSDLFASNVGGSQIIATDLSSVNVENTIVNGNAFVFVNANLGAQVFVSSIVIPAGAGVNINFWFDVDAATVTGTPAWSVAGSVAGAKYACGNNSVISFNSAWPAGLSAGTSATGCQVQPP